jgi:hypothetical protein
MFRNYAMELWSVCSGKYLDRDTILREGRPAAGFVTYPVRCLTVVEILAMLGILEKHRDPILSAKIADYLSTFVEANIGAAHPISDRWAVSLACCVLQLSTHGKTGAVKSYLRSAIKWIADKYDNGDLGLAGPHSLPDEETEYLLGSPFEYVHRERRLESYAATQVLDLCSVLEDEDLFNVARNEFLAVNICPPVLEVDDDRAQYSIDSSGQRYEPNIPYQEQWRPSENWKVAPHHNRGPERRYPESTGGIWDQLAISCVVRDRHFVRPMTPKT